MKLADQLKDLSHHAYCIVGSAAIRADLVSILEKKHKIHVRGNPDFFDRMYLTFTIDDAREVKAQAEMRPVSMESEPGRGKKIFILAMNGITIEAQNALLKLLEEPPGYAHFFLILPSAHLLLPTVKSRLSLLDGESEREGEKVEAKDFLALAPAKRLDFVKKFMEEIVKEKRPKQDAIDFLNAVQETIHAQGITGVKGNAARLEAIETARTYMNDRSPSLKMLLEYVALSV